MSIKYVDVSLIIKHLNHAHDPKVARIRDNFFEKENRFFKKHIQNEVVLVAGCGIGHDSFELAKYNTRVIGVDILEPLILMARSLANKKGIKNVQFLMSDICTLPSHMADTAVLNMGTIGNFENKKEAIASLSNAATRVFFDFYPPGERNLQTRQKMYSQEGWHNVKIVDETIVSSDGLKSVSIRPEEVSAIARQLNLAVEFYDICEFAVMAELTRK